MDNDYIFSERYFYKGRHLLLALCCYGPEKGSAIPAKLKKVYRGCSTGAKLKTKLTARRKGYKTVLLFIITGNVNSLSNKCDELEAFVKNHTLHKWLLLSWDPVLPPPVQDAILTPSPPICICMFQVVVTWLALIAWPRRKWLRPTLVWRPLPIVICNTSASKASEKFLVSILTTPRSLSQRSNMIWHTTCGKDTALRYDNACQTPL